MGSGETHQHMTGTEEKKENITKGNKRVEVVAWRVPIRTGKKEKKKGREDEGGPHGEI
jgi:hypothetical protein